VEHPTLEMLRLETESIMQIFDVESEATEVPSSPSLARPSLLQNIFDLHEQRETIGDLEYLTLLLSL